MVQNQLFIHEGFLGDHGKDRILYTFPPVYVYKVNVNAFICTNTAYIF